MIMDYSTKNAAHLIGKRVVISLRKKHPENEDEYNGLWGVINAVRKDGILVEVEGGIDEEFWMMPPDLSSIKKAENKYYQLRDDGQIVADVDYEAFYSIADHPNYL